MQVDLHFWAHEHWLLCCVHVQLLLDFGPCASETLYPLNSLCQKWKSGYANGMFSWCSSNSATVKHEGNFPLISALLLGCKRNYKLWSTRFAEEQTQHNCYTIEICPNLFWLFIKLK